MNVHRLNSNVSVRTLQVVQARYHVPVPNRATGSPLVQLILMQCRTEQLLATMNGVTSTGIPLVSATAAGLAPAATSDDIGLYLFAPWLASLLRIDVLTAAAVLLFGTLLVCFLIGTTGLIRLTPSRASWVYSIVMALGVSYVAYRASDVYIVSAALPLAIAPWAVLLVATKASWRKWLLFVVLAGAVLGAGHVIRSHSGAPVLVLVTFLILATNATSGRAKALLIAALIGAFASSLALARYPVNVRDAYLEKQVVGYTPAPSRHPLWHSIYIGLGYVPNEVVPQYLDEVAVAAVERLEPGAEYLSTTYERTLRDEVFRIVREEPRLVARVVLAKSGSVLVQLILALNLGAIALALKRGRPPVLVLAAFAAAILMGTMNGLLVVPAPQYLVGMHSMAAVLAALAIALLLDPRLSEALTAATTSNRNDTHRTQKD